VETKLEPLVSNPGESSSKPGKSPANISGWKIGKKIIDSSKHSLQRVIVLRSDDSFGGKPEVIYGSHSGRRKKKKRKKQSRVLKPLEKSVFKLAKRYDEATSEYKKRHSRSNKKKKNGWIKDFVKNYGKAMSKLMDF
jgi:hypothetical protein